MIRLGKNKFFRVRVCFSTGTNLFLTRGQTTLFVLKYNNYHCTKNYIAFKWQRDKVQITEKKISILESTSQQH